MTDRERPFEPAFDPEPEAEPPSRRRGHPRVRIGLEVAGRTLRYAEVDLGPRPDPYAPQRLSLDPPPPPPTRLLRLGACDFEFDVAEALLDPAGPTHLDTVGAALHEVFAESRAGRLHVAVHPWHATSFFAPLPEGMPAAERLEQLRQEAAMLADARAVRSVRVTATAVRKERLRDGRRVLWHHVLRVPEAVHARADHLAERLGSGAEAAIVDAPGTVAALVARHDEAARNVALALGAYGARFEVAVVARGAWRFAHWAETTSADDAAYFVAALLRQLRLPLQRVGCLLTYGEAEGHPAVEGVERLLDRPAQPVDPLAPFPRARRPAEPTTLAAFAPCVAAALAG